MESKDCKWLKTMSDGVLLFKNIAFSVKETDKPDKKDEDDEYAHTEENCVIQFDKPEDKYMPGQRYYHTEMCVFCSVTEKVTDDDGKLKEVKIRLDNLDSEASIQNDEKELAVLSDTLDVNIRVVQKTGSKLTIKGKYSLFDNMQGNLKSILGSVGFNSGSFKVFHNDKLVDKNIDIDKIYEPGKDIYFMAFESLGKPKRWMRFPKVYEWGTWSNSGSSSDGITFIPKQSIQVCGFVAYGCKDEAQYEMKYKLIINGQTKEEGPPTVYTNWEDTYYKTINFKDTYDAPANSRVEIIMWCGKSPLGSYNYCYTYYGTDGYSYQDVKNEDMGLFTLDSASESGNGTSTSSGNVPGILYYL